MAEGWGGSGGSHCRNDASLTVCNFSPQRVVWITSWNADRTGRTDNIYRLPDKEGRASDTVPGHLSLFWLFWSNGQLSLSGCQDFNSWTWSVLNKWEPQRQGGGPEGRREFSTFFFLLKTRGIGNCSHHAILRKGAWVPDKFISTFGCKMPRVHRALLMGPCPHS